MKSTEQSLGAVALWATMIVVPTLGLTATDRPLAAAASAGVMVCAYLGARALRRREAQNGAAGRARTRRLTSELVMLRAGSIPARHPRLMGQMRVFERAVIESLNAISRGGIDLRSLSHLEYLVYRTAADALAPLEHTEHKEAVNRACREFQRLSLHLVSTYLDTGDFEVPPATTTTGANTRPQATRAQMRT